MRGAGRLRGARAGSGAEPRGVGASRRRGPRVKRFRGKALVAKSALAGRWRAGRPAPRGGQGGALGADVPTSQRPNHPGQNPGVGSRGGPGGGGEWRGPCPNGGPPLGRGLGRGLAAKFGFTSQPSQPSHPKGTIAKMEALRGGPPLAEVTPSGSEKSCRGGWASWDVEPNLAARPRPNPAQGLGRRRGWDVGTGGVGTQSRVRCPGGWDAVRGRGARRLGRWDVEPNLAAGLRPDAPGRVGGGVGTLAVVPGLGVGTLGRDLAVPADPPHGPSIDVKR